MAPLPARLRNFPWPALLIVAAGIAVYVLGGSLHGAFIYDDFGSIVDNAHIRTLWPLWVPLTTTGHVTVSGRPVVGLTLAINYALGGLKVYGYHVFNLVVHLLDGVLVWSLLRQTLMNPRWAGRFSASANGLATAVALIWIVHPLLTEAVVYVMQRTELLVTLFYLLTLYAAINSWRVPHTIPSGWCVSSPGQGERSPDIGEPAHTAPLRDAMWHPSGNLALHSKARASLSPFREWLWIAAAVGACGLGMATKEVMVSAPLFVLLYDGVFCSESYGQALRKHRVLYAGLAATWLVLAAMLMSGPRGATVGYGLGVSMWDYLRTQAWAIMWYLRLCFWPHPLAILPDPPLIRTFGAALPYALPVLALLGISAWGVWRRSWVGVAGGLFFLILAPSSSFVPIVTEVVGERRMYLPSAVVVAVVVVGVYVLFQRWLGRLSRTAGAVVAVVAVLGVTVGLAAGSVRRLADYQSETNIWQANLALYPHSARTLFGLGFAAGHTGDDALAISYYKLAVAEWPNYLDPWFNMGNCYLRMNRFAEAAAAYEQALRINPGYPKALENLAAAQIGLGRWDDARAELEQWVRAEPGNSQAHARLAFVLRHVGQPGLALAQFSEAARLAPQDADAQNNLAAALIIDGHPEEAEPHLRAALRINPRHAVAASTLGGILLDQGRVEEAIGYLRTAMEVKPNDPAAADALGKAYARVGRFPEAVAAEEEALKRCRGGGMDELKREIGHRLALYRAGRADGAGEPDTMRR